MATLEMIITHCSMLITPGKTHVLTQMLRKLFSGGKIGADFSLSKTTTFQPPFRDEEMVCLGRKASVPDDIWAT